MARCRTIQDFKWALEVFKKCMEEFISMEGTNEKKTNLRSNGKGEQSKFSLSKVKFFPKEDA